MTNHMWTGEPQALINVRKANKALNMAISALEQMPEVTSTMQTGQFDYADPYQTDMDDAWEQARKGESNAT